MQMKKLIPGTWLRGVTILCLLFSQNSLVMAGYLGIKKYRGGSQCFY